MCSLLQTYLSTLCQCVPLCKWNITDDDDDDDDDDEDDEVFLWYGWPMKGV